MGSLEKEHDFNFFSSHRDRYVPALKRVMGTQGPVVGIDYIQIKIFMSDFFLNLDK